MAENGVDAWGGPIAAHGHILYNVAMTTKEIALKTIEQLPENASWEEIQERINFIVGVRKGLRELDEGKGIPHDKIKEEFAEWLTN
jgi:predicted transcriptional regulator